MRRIGLRLVGAALLFAASIVLAQASLDAFDPSIVRRHPWFPPMVYVCVAGLLATILSAPLIARCIHRANEREMRLVGILPSVLLASAVVSALVAAVGAVLYAIDLANLGPVS